MMDASTGTPAPGPWVPASVDMIAARSCSETQEVRGSNTQSSISKDFDPESKM